MTDFSAKQRILKREKTMIINTGARTDTVQYFTEWLLKRFEEGFVYSRNPLFPNKVSRYELTPEKVDCVLFCSKNYKPILPNLHKITQKFNTYFHYTITAYGKDIEPGVPLIEESMETLLELEKIVGKNRIAWRYDPVLLTKNYTIERHFEIFEKMCATLNGHIDRCIFSFVEIYKKLEINFPELKIFTDYEIETLAQGFGKIAQKYGIFIQTCGTNVEFTKYGIHSSACTSLEVLAKANGIEFKPLKHKGQRLGCHCFESRDIGAYETCLNACKYCYANKNHKKALQNYKLHNPNSPLLLGELNETDIVTQAEQKSLLVNKPNIEKLENISNIGTLFEM